MWKIICLIFYEGYNITDTSTHYGFLYKIVCSIAKAFIKDGCLLAKLKRKNHFAIFGVEYILWLREHLDNDMHDTIEDLHQSLNQVFTFPHLISINTISWAIRNQVRYILKLMYYKLDDNICSSVKDFFRNW